MTLALNIDTRAWRANIKSVQDSFPGLVPVAKGNGYGFGLEALAREAARMNEDCIAVGIAEEVAVVRAAGWSRDVVVLNPWRPFDAAATALLEEPGVITTVSRLEDLDALVRQYPRARVLVELRTSMNRHGLTLEEVVAVDTGTLGFEGWAIHLPPTGALAEAQTLASTGVAHQRGAVWVSHLDATHYAKLRTHLGGSTRMRIGTKLWMGDASTYSATGSVLDLHRVSRGTRFGYHNGKVTRDGWLAVVSGGTAHGIALAAPKKLKSLRDRVNATAEWALDEVGRQVSPFRIGKKKASFAEPPHMHASMLFLPGADPGVQVGDEVPVTCRMTTTTFDELRWN